MALPAQLEDDAWAPASERLQPNFEGLIQEDSEREFPPDEVMRVLEELSQGYGLRRICLSMGWSPAQIKRFESDPDRKELIGLVREALNDDVEHAIYLGCKAHNATALKLWAYTKMADRGYADRREMRMDVHSQQEIVVSVRAALDAHTRELVEQNGVDGIRALQAAYLTADDPEEDDDIIDAEVIGEDLHPG